MVGADKSIYHLTNSYLFSIAVRYTMDEHLAMDVLQESYIKIFDSLKQFIYKSEAATFQWMKQICINESLKLIHKNKRKYQIESGVRFSNTVFNNHDLHVQDLYRILSQLPDQQRVVFNLYAIEGYAHKEISQLLEIKEVYSRTLLARARKFLNKNISKLNYVAS